MWIIELCNRFLIFAILKTDYTCYALRFLSLSDKNRNFIWITSNYYSFCWLCRILLTSFEKIGLFLCFFRISTLVFKHPRFGLECARRLTEYFYNRFLHIKLVFDSSKSKLDINIKRRLLITKSFLLGNIQWKENTKLRRS